MHALEGNGVRISMRRYQAPPGVWLGQVLWVWPDADSVWLLWPAVDLAPAARFVRWLLPVGGARGPGWCSGSVQRED